MILEPCVEGEKGLMRRAHGVEVKYFYFYTLMIVNFKVDVSLTIFQINILKAMNVACFQLHSNTWPFSQVFEILCFAFDIVSAA